MREKDHLKSNGCHIRPTERVHYCGILRGRGGKTKGKVLDVVIGTKTVYKF